MCCYSTPHARLSAASKWFVYDSSICIPIWEPLWQYKSSTPPLFHMEKRNQINAKTELWETCLPHHHTLKWIPNVCPCTMSSSLKWRLKEKKKPLYQELLPIICSSKRSSKHSSPALTQGGPPPWGGLLHYCSPFPPVRFQTHHRKAEAFQPLCSLVVKDTVCGTVHSNNNVILFAPGMVTRWGLLEYHRHHRNILFHLTTQPEKEGQSFQITL